MANKIDKRFNYSFRKKKNKITHPYLSEDTSSRFANYTELMANETSISSSSNSVQSYSKIQFNTAAICALTIILFFATWIFKKTTYVLQALFRCCFSAFQTKLTPRYVILQPDL